MTWLFINTVNLMNHKLQIILLIFNLYIEFNWIIMNFILSNINLDINYDANYMLMNNSFTSPNVERFGVSLTCPIDKRFWWWLFIVSLNTIYNSFAINWSQLVYSNCSFSSVWIKSSGKQNSHSLASPWLILGPENMVFNSVCAHFNVDFIYFFTGESSYGFTTVKSSKNLTIN